MFKAEKALNTCCESCNSIKLLHVHHVNYRDLLSCEISDLAILCEQCHYDLHEVLKIEGKKSSDIPASEIKQVVARFRLDPRWKIKPITIDPPRRKRKHKKKKSNTVHIPPPPFSMFKQQVKRLIRHFQQHGYRLKDVPTLCDDIMRAQKQCMNASEIARLIGSVSADPF